MISKLQKLDRPYQQYPLLQVGDGERDNERQSEVDCPFPLI